MKLIYRIFLVVISLSVATASAATDTENTHSLDIEQHKRELVEFNNEIEELKLFAYGPRALKAGIYLRMFDNPNFKPTYVQLKIPGESVLRKKYKEAESVAFEKGGIDLLSEVAAKLGMMEIELVVKGESISPYTGRPKLVTLEYNGNVKKEEKYLKVLFSIKPSSKANSTEISMRVW